MILLWYDKKENNIEKYFSNNNKKLKPKEIMKCAERVINLERLFNYRKGFDRKDDRLPVRLITEPAPDGLGKGNVANVDIMIDEFYESMGGNKETGFPTEDKLKELNLM